jgi:hypothetical protein
MEDIALETNAAAGFQAPKTHLSSLLLWQRQGSPQTPTTTAQSLVSPLLGCATRDSGQCGEENSGH